MKIASNLLFLLISFTVILSANAENWPHDHTFNIQQYDRQIPDAMAAAEYSLDKRGWSIVSRTKNSYIAMLKKNSVDAKIRIEVSDALVKILSDSKRGAIGDDPANLANKIMLWSPYYPRGWIGNIEKDMENYLATVPALPIDEETGSTLSQETVEARLVSLKAQYEKQLITEQEYQQKRTEILSEL